MGYGSYSASDWARLRDSRKLSDEQEVDEVFKNKTCNPRLNPRYIGKRECFDSAEHPNTTPIVVGLDVTGSMGYLAVEIASGALNELITKLYSTECVQDPALMCAAYGDYQDEFPLQVTQFESDIRIAEQLLEIYFENRGSGQVVPTLLWEFLSRHTNIDAIQKRGKKGYVFTIGDSAPIRTEPKKIYPSLVSRVIGDNDNDLSRDLILREVSQKFHVFHIMVDRTQRGNQDCLPGRKIVIAETEIKSLPQIIISTIQLQNGEDKEKILNQWDPIEQPIVRKALDQLCITDDEQEINL